MNDHDNIVSKGVSLGKRMTVCCDELEANFGMSNRRAQLTKQIYSCIISHIVYTSV